ncbi:hypothetical protein C7S18_19150 [Ahniella affigens]|uniref:Uncharacterized protein n=1 Tax=Ahniella affigens TaxID=2021234 RepID=A0A2P1PWB9_9GAMM|nr:hypothetical protein [Ahniella affigens]AVP99155.1 hypothetical protein C7S18_19150 [Ahniella affigens]
MRHIKGFSLVSLVIALGLVSIAGVLAIQYQLRQSRARLAQTWIEAQAREMDQIVAAVRTWTNTPSNVASWANDTRTGIGCDTLINAGLLPTAFGRDGTLCKSPFGTVYTINGIKNFADTTLAQGRVRAIIFATGPAPNPYSTGALRRIGIPNTSNGIQGIAMRTAITLAERKIPAGWLPAGGTTATGAGRAWTKALANWLGTAPPQATAVALVGFPDIGGTLEPTGPTRTCTNGEIVRGLCSGNLLCQAGGAGWTPPTCPAGKVKVAEFPHCLASNVFQYNTGLGSSLILGTREIDLGQSRSYQDCAAFAAEYNPDANSAEYQSYLDDCKDDRDIQYETTIYVDGPQPPNYCGLVFHDYLPNPNRPGTRLLTVSYNTWGAPQARDIICATCQ